MVKLYLQSIVEVQQLFHLRLQKRCEHLYMSFMR